MARKSKEKVEDAPEQTQEAPTEEATSASPQNGTDEPTKARGRPRKAAPEPSNGPSADRVAEYLARYTTLKTEAQRVAQAISTELTNFEKEGGDKKALKALHDSLKLDPDEARRRLETLVRYHGGQDIRVSWQDDGQSTLDDVLADPAPTTAGRHDLAKARAHADGYNSGKAGAIPSDNPFRHQPGSEEYVSWHDGRDEGQRDREARKPEAAARQKRAKRADASLPSDMEPVNEVPF